MGVGGRPSDRLGMASKAPAYHFAASYTTVSRPSTLQIRNFLRYSFADSRRRDSSGIEMHGSLANPRILQSNNLQGHSSLMYMAITPISRPIETR
jgi:hypothetical protein